uniref:NADH-ubiquinone oxidoreductase chain 6 n=4 Tax=Oedipodinae TaxID=27549 RepID=A0A6G6A772_9ORTH|nr:NADH dehydrogenase subunit 6 [Angaracris barabensis]YP_009740638.1 NADH dehydrogenase subunit 6 [Bryodemella holdereri holdereri]YP_009740729.1 NADH dehydrogenase subunit 6 [Bryodema dolichoptera]AKQ49222.1 NADH dehydrogenase subunit 6 [Bryodema miramae miramae]AIT96940.1 NADH dehydrogenase subunit 6 [Angaracris barabensis]QID03600.1 NADH dehydrogenase subunit 6 [Bryodemella holdereri holdereri]QID03704.1 NADH dehydrogenase subunit 6 [Bryodema dolichoptera]
MFKMLIMSMSNMLNINFINMNHPMLLMIMIIIQTLLIGVMTGLMMESFWLSYILFLTFIGGMMVLFIYITSISSNEMFNIKSMSMIFIMITMLIMMIVIYSTEKILFTEMIKSTETMNMKYTMNFQEMTMSLTKLYNNPTLIITIMMMIYLFMALLAVVKINNINKGPIRKMK